MSLQKLPSSLRKRQRYVVFRSIGSEGGGFEDAVRAIWRGMLAFMGENGVAAADPWVMKNLYDEDENMGVVRVKHECVEEARTSLALVREMGGREICFTVEGVTGTVDAAEEKYL